MALTIGLGRHSPIPLEGDPKKYEGLIIRHGQWVRWMSSRKCTCILATNRPDPRCPYCKGIGWRYSFQSDEEDMAVEAQIVDASTVEMPYEVSADRISLIQGADGTIYTLDSVFGKWIRVQGSPFPDRGLIYVSVRKDRALSMEGQIAVYKGSGIVQLQPAEYQNPWARVPLDILSVTSLARVGGSACTVLESSVDKILIDISAGEPAVGETLYAAIQYMPPYRIAILNQNISELDQKALQEVGGDAIAVFPYAYKVAEQDTITVWASTQIRKKILRREEGDLTYLPDLFVTRVVRLETLEREYVEGTDFVLWDRNAVRWLIDESLRPAVGKNYSIEYAANATYRVMMQFPNIRSAEDKRFPVRVGVKLESGTTGSDQI